MHWLDYLLAPNDWLGGVVPLDLQIGTGENAAIFITHLTAYPIGFEFHFIALTRDDPGVVCREALQAAKQAKPLWESKGA